MPNELKPAKPGYKTTEFWMAFAASVVSFVYASGVLDAVEGDVDNKIVGVIGGVLASMGYAVSRGLAKKTP